MARIKKEEKERIRKKIIDESAKMFDENGYDGTSTKNLAKAVGIAEGTLFNYFKSKAEIYLEVMSVDYEVTDINTLVTKKDDDVARLVFELIEKDFDFFFRLPKPIIREVASVTAGLAKSKPGLAKKLAELDFRFIDNLEKYLVKLGEEGLLRQEDSRELSEIIYGMAIYELIIYVYETDMKKELIYSSMQKKLKIILLGYITP